MSYTDQEKAAIIAQYKQGISVQKLSTKYVAKLMREMGLSSIRTTAKQDYLKLHEPEKKKNILQQQFQADRPNQIWVSDVTCFKLENHYLYTCVILDLFSRKVVAYKISKKNSTQLITSTFKMAWEQRTPEAKLIFHITRFALQVCTICVLQVTSGKNKQKA